LKTLEVTVLCPSFKGQP